MSITKILLTFLLIYILIYLFTKNKGKNGIEKYTEKEKLAKVPSQFILSDNNNYEAEIKKLFNLTNEDYKDLVELPKGSKVRINLKKDWRSILNNEIDSINNNIDIKYTNLSNQQIDSQFIYELSSSINSVFEYQMDKYDTSLEDLVNDEKNQYVLDNTDFNNLFENKDFDYYKEYELNAQRYDTTGHLINLTDEPLNEQTNLDDNFQSFYTYEVYCGYDNADSENEDEGDTEDEGDENSEGNVLDINQIADEVTGQYGDDIQEYHQEYVRMKVEKPEDLPFKLVEYQDVTEGLVNNFREFEDMVLNKLNYDVSLFIAADTLENIQNFNINGFSIVDRKINYILKNTELNTEHFYNGEIVVHRERNHGIHIKIEGLKQRSNYYITNFNILGIVINDKINKLETINDNIINPVYHLFKDKHVIVKSELEKELANIIDQGAIENYLYLFSKFKKFRAERGVNINDFELFVYTTRIIMDIQRSDNFNRINEINNPSIFTQIFG